MQHFICWAFQRCPLHNRTDCYDGSRTPLQRLTDAWHGQNGANTNHWVTGANDNGFSLGQGCAHTRRGLGLLYPVIDDLQHLLLTAALHEIFLEVKEPGGCTDQARDRLIRHRQDTDSKAKCLTERHGDIRQALPHAPTLRAQDMRPQITVAEMEPRRFAIALQHSQALKSIATNAPTALFVDQATQRVGHNIDIRRNMQAIEFDVIARIADDGECSWRNHVDQAT